MRPKVVDKLSSYLAKLKLELSDLEIMSAEFENTDFHYDFLGDIKKTKQEIKEVEELLSRGISCSWIT